MYKTVKKNGYSYDTHSLKSSCAFIHPSSRLILVQDDIHVKKKVRYNSFLKIITRFINLIYQKIIKLTSLTHLFFFSKAIHSEKTFPYIDSTSNNEKISRFYRFAPQEIVDRL